MSAEIRNPHQSTVPLPLPYQGLLRPGEACVVSASVEEVLALGVGGLRVREVPDSRGSVPFTVLDETIGPLTLYVDVATGNDNSIGSQTAPLASITEAESRIPLRVAHEVVIRVIAAPSGSYAWPTFRGRVFSQNVVIWIIFDTDFQEVIAPGDTGQGGSGTGVLVTSGGLTPGALNGNTIEILDGASVGDRRTIRDNTATNIIPNAAFTADVTGASYRVFRPALGNRIAPVSGVPMVQGLGVPEAIPLSISLAKPDFSPGVRVVNAIVVSALPTAFVMDARISFFGCELENDGGGVVYIGTGQVLFGRSAWNRVDLPAEEVAAGLLPTSWVGWGVAFTGGHIPNFTGSVPYISGYVNAPAWTQFGGEVEITGHIEGPLRCTGENNTIDTKRPRLTFGALAPLLTPRVGIGKITNASASLAAIFAQTRAYVIVGDETSIESSITDGIFCSGDAEMRLNLDVNFDGATGGNGIVVEKGSHLLVSSAGSMDINGSIAGDELRVGNRPVVAAFADLGGSGDFVSAGRAFWDSGLAASGDAVTLSAPGAVVAVEATTATSAGVKQVQFSAAPGAGFVRVEYDASGVPTLTFNGTDAVTVAAVLVRPEDDGSVAQAL